MNAQQRFIDDAITEFQFLEGDRSNFDRHCKEIAERFIPSHKNLFTSRGSPQTKGEKRNQEIYDSTGPIALTRFVAIMDWLVTPSNQTYHNIVAFDPVLSKYREVKEWFEAVNRLLFTYRYAPKANFVAQNQPVYKSLGAYGNGCMYIDRLFDDDGGVRYRNVHLSDVYFLENHQGLVDKVHRRMMMTGRQVKQRWPNNVPKKIQAEKNEQKEWTFLHCVKPRKDYDPNRFDYKGKPWGSYYIFIEEKELVEEEGYFSFPYAVARYEQAPGETYGRSPAMDVLPAKKTLNEQKKTMLRQGHRATDPVLLVHDDGVLDAPSIRPGAVLSGAVTADGRPLVHTLPTGNFPVLRELMEMEQEVINDAFHTSLFQLLHDSPQKTATEVLELTKEKGILLGPIGRVQAEYIARMVEREIDLLAEQDLLPPMPPVLVEAGGRYKVEYESPLTRSQRAGEAVGFFRTLEQAIAAVNVTQDLSLLDIFDFETALPEAAEINGMPVRWLRTEEAIAEIRQMRAEQQQQQQMVQAAPGAAALAKSVAAVRKG